ncbi:hypothetical protein LCGC14_2951980 [marine sediment metagenome]|uniref:Peptidase M15A C-terminal domain-containing protein n=1 Tax=marine sediment metagenome TaxID=412755 RepID=A0A0F9A655_9ZZZZ
MKRASLLGFFLFVAGLSLLSISSPILGMPESPHLPMYPPVALLQSVAIDDGYPTVGTTKSLVLSALSSESVEIARTVNRCFYYVSGRPAIVTAFSNGRHREGSAHYLLKAVDFRLRHLTKKEVVRVLNCSEVLLGEGYYVAVEWRPLHLHAALRMAGE